MKSKKKFKNILRKITTKIQPFKTYGMQQKLFLEESSHRPSLRNKKNIKNNLIHHLKELEKEQTKPTFSRRKEITKIREEINKIEILKNTKKINKTKSSFFERVNRIYKPLARLIGKTDGPNEIRNERGEITRYCRERKKQTKRIL